jgi:oligopeptide transport system substrate-binding protein
VSRALSAAAAAALAVTLGLTGCTSSETSTPSPAAVAGATAGGVLRVGILPPRNIAPWLVSGYDPSGTLIAKTMCDPLIGLDVNTGELRPAIAMSWRLQTGSSFVLKLRKGLTFSDGRSVKTQDIATSISRAANSEVGSPVSDVLAPIQGYSTLAGLKQQSLDPKLRDRLSGVKTLTSSSLQIDLIGNNAEFIRAMSHTLTAVVPQKDWKADAAALERKPVCVGPYQLDQPWTGTEKVITLRRSAHYTPHDTAYSAGGKGYADTIEMHVYRDDAQVRKAFDKGEVDIAYVGPRAAAGSPDLTVAPTPTVDYIGLPTTTAPFDRADVRVALSLALDREKIARDVFGGMRTAAAGFVSPAVGKDYDDRSTSACSKTIPATAQVEASRSLLSRNSVQLAGTHLKLSFNDEPGNRALVTAVALQWTEAFGVVVELTPMPAAEFLDRGTTSGFDGPFRFSWSPQVPGVDDYIGPLFASASLGRDNWSRFTDSAVDYPLDHGARDQLTDKSRRAKYQLIQSMLCLTMPMIPVLDGGRPVLVHRDRIASAVSSFAERSSGHVPLRELFLMEGR